jgi:hypothetical protein
MERIFKYNKILIFCAAIIFGITACDSALKSRVGIGNTIIFLVGSVILTLIARGIGFLLGLIPIVGHILRFLVGAIIILWWLILVIGCILNYGWLSIPLAIVIIIIFLGCCGGPDGIIIIFFG